MKKLLSVYGPILSFIVLHSLTGLSVTLLGCIYLIGLVFYGLVRFGIGFVNFVKETALENKDKKAGISPARNVTPHGQFTADDMRFMPKN